MAPTKTDRGTRKARIEQFEARTEADPLGTVQADTDAEFDAEGHIPRGAEASTQYLERNGPVAKGKRKPAR
jgi:hypothetical protein